MMMLKVGKEQLRAMSEQELAEFAWLHLGLHLEPTWTKAKMLEKLIAAATKVVNS